MPDPVRDVVDAPAADPGPEPPADPTPPPPAGAAAEPTPVRAPHDTPRSRLLPGTRSTDAGEVVRSAPREHGTVWSWLVLGGTVAAGAVGAVVVALAVRAGADGGSGAAALTWLGLVVGLGPAVTVALSRDATAAARWTAMLTAALVTAVPVGLRTANGPATPDDLVRYAHLSALRDGAPLLTGRFPAVVADQPGLPALTAALGRVSGLTVWHSALVVLVVAHVAAVVGARALVRAMGFGERVAVLAAVLWSLGPAVLVATSRVGGATLGLAVLLWSVAAVLQAATAASPTRRLAWTGTAVGLAAATAVTDLPTAWVLVGLTVLVGLVTVGVTAPPVAGSAVRRAWWPAGAGGLVVTALWSVLPPGRRVQGDLGDLGALGAGSERVWSVGPGEVTLAVLATLAALGLAGLGVHRARHRLGETGPRYGLALAALFPVSLLGLLAAPTTTLVVLVWPVLAAGLAPYVAAGLQAVWDLGARRTRSAGPDRSVGATLRRARRDTRADRLPGPTPVGGRPADDPGRPRRDRRVPLAVAGAAAVVASALVLTGATAATAPSAAEPVGLPLTTGRVAVSTTEVLAVADRLTDLAGRDARFLASDRDLGAVLAVVTGGEQVTTVAPADVFDTTPTARTATTLRAAGIGWLVDATLGGQGALALTPWLVRVLATPSLTVYRVRPAVPGADADDSSAATDGVVAVTSS